MIIDTAVDGIHFETALTAFLFPRGLIHGMRQCISVLILSDERLESNKRFFVVIHITSPSNPNVIIGLTRASVDIIDGRHFADSTCKILN